LLLGISEYQTKNICAEVSLSSIKGIAVNSNSSIVCIKKIDVDCLIFSSDLKLPVTKNVTWSFRTRLCDERVNLLGNITKINELGPHHYQYNVKLTLSDFDKANLTRLLNDLTSKLNKSLIQPSCSFCVKDRPEECFSKACSSPDLLLVAN